MKKCNCMCSIVPPYIVEYMTKDGKIKISTESIEAESDMRAKRAKKIDTLNSFAAAPEAVGSSNRMVYDCKNRRTLRKNLTRSEGQAPVVDPVVNAVYDNTGIVREFFKTQYNWLSFDNNGGTLHLNVHYLSNYNNAGWDGDEMVFGDGDGVIFVNLGNSLDVTGHEITHGVIQYTANLVYSKQPGALNEHMADVFGVTIRQFKEGTTGTPDTANWLIGDTIMGPTLQGQALRSMKAPGTAYNNTYMGKDPQPDHMSKYYTGTSDNYGVHINSGIPNKVFYLVSVAFGDTLKAALLWFETLKTMTSTDNFATFKTRILAKAVQLETQGKIPAGSNAMITQSFATVGL